MRFWHEDYFLWHVEHVTCLSWCKYSELEWFINAICIFESKPSHFKCHSRRTATTDRKWVRWREKESSQEVKIQFRKGGNLCDFLAHNPNVHVNDMLLCQRHEDKFLCVVCAPKMQFQFQSCENDNNNEWMRVSVSLCVIWASWTSLA